MSVYLQESDWRPLFSPLTWATSPLQVSVGVC